MKESENSYPKENDSFWDYVKENPRIIGLPVSENKGIDILGALRDIREAYKVNGIKGDIMLTLLGSLLVGAAQGQGDKMIEEVIVSEAMDSFDTHLKGILDEGH
jgi:hypothetical protein